MCFQKYGVFRETPLLSFFIAMNYISNGVFCSVDQDSGFHRDQKTTKVRKSSRAENLCVPGLELKSKSGLANQIQNFFGLSASILRGVPTNVTKFFATVSC